MRTKLIISLGMLTALAVGCSKSFPTVDENAWIYDESLPVPIQFGSLSSEVATKAVIDHFPGGEFQQPFGVFAWDEDSSDGMQVSAKSIFPNGYKRAEIYTANGISNIRFQEQGAEVKPAYYPMSSKYNYSFYAYHTGTEEIAGSYVDDSYVLNLDFSEPFNDVLWGKFAESDLPYGDELPRLFYKVGDATPLKGFNARFSRAAGKQEEVAKEKYYPVINFEHICTAFRFYAKADSMSSADYTRLSNLLKITSVSISNVPSAATLTVASTDSNKEGKLDPTSEKTVVDMTFEPGITPTGWNSEEGKGSVMKTGTEDRFFLPPGDYSGSVVTIGFTVNGSNDTLEFPLEYKGSTDFEAGKCYSFVVIFKSIEEISLRATVSDWDEEHYTSVDPFDFDNE